MIKIYVSLEDDNDNGNARPYKVWPTSIGGIPLNPHYSRSQ